MLNFFKRFYRTDYMIVYRFLKDDLDILKNTKKTFTVFNNNHKYWYADPILYKYNNTIYMFYEAYNKRKNRGEIGVATVTNNRIVNKKIIISEPFHMSYPFVFELNNKIYMIPETSSVKKLLLYECVYFPYEWKLSKELMNNVELSDATILKDSDKKLYLFVSKLYSTSPYKDELHLFTMDNEFILTPHKCNPIVTDNEFSRPAGKILEYNNKLIRVSQDCSNGGYGKAIKFNEIIKLSDSEYQETNISSLLPNQVFISFNKKLTGTHTYARMDEFEVIDVRYSVFDIKKLLNFLYNIPFKVLRRTLKIQ